MEVRRNIALKLKEPPPSSTPPITPAVSLDSLDKKKASNLNAVNKAWEQLQWDQPLNLVGRPIPGPLLHICELCDHPILIYGRMKRCRHAFCRDCAKKAAGECPKCHEGEQTFEEACMGNVHICTYGGGRYDNKGCGRSYLSQRDLEAHIAYRHKDKSLISPSSSTTAAATLPPLTLQSFFPAPGTAAPTLPPNFAQARSLPPTIPRPPTGALHPIPIPGFSTQQSRFPPPTTANWTRPFQ